MMYMVEDYRYIHKHFIDTVNMYVFFGNVFQINRINLNKDYILLYQEGIELQGIEYDIAIASYIINPTNNK